MPAPPSTSNSAVPVTSTPVVMVSAPSPVPTLISSCASPPVTCTSAPRPDTTCAPPSLPSWTRSSSCVPPTMTSRGRRRGSGVTANVASSVPAVLPATSVSLPPKASSSMRSTPPRSVTTLAMSRSRRTREPLAETSIVSAALLPLKSRTSAPASPSTTSLSSPGFQVRRSLPVPSRAVSSPSPPETASLPLPPSSVWSPRPPISVSAPLPPSKVVTSSLSMAKLLDLVVAAAGQDVDRGEGAAVEAELGDEVAVEVHLERGRDADLRAAARCRPRRWCR